MVIELSNKNYRGISVENQDCFTCKYDDYDLDCFECRGCICNFGTRTDKWKSKKEPAVKVVIVEKPNAFTSYFNKTSGYGSFQLAIMRAITKADYSNLHRLAKGFPELVNDYLITMQWCKNDIKKIMEVN